MFKNAFRPYKKNNSQDNKDNNDNKHSKEIIQE